MNRFAPILVCLCVSLAGCATNPVSGNLEFVTTSEEKEIQLGQQAKERFLSKSPDYYDADLIHYINKIGKRIAANSHRPGLNYTFTILDSPAINAYALYGGHVFITRGLLAHLNNEAELAGFLGHEIAHIAARHGVKTLTRKDLAKSARMLVFNWLAFTEQAKSLTHKLSTPLVYSYQPQAELMADRLSAQYLAKSGYNPQAMRDNIAFLSQLEQYRQAEQRRLGIERTDTHRLYNFHPDTSSRLNLTIPDTRQSNIQREHNAALYQRLINRIDYGYNERFGIAVDNVIYFKPHNLKITLPANWQISQKGYEYLVISPDGKSAIELTILLPSKVTAPRAVDISIDKNGARSFGNGGSILNTQAKTSEGEKSADLVLFAYNDAVLLSVNAYSDTANSLNEIMLNIQNQLSPIPENEQHLGETRKIHIITAKANDTYASLAKLSNLGKNAQMQLRLLNRAWPEGKIQAGQKIKIIK